MNLARLLSLTPLSKVQLFNREQIREASIACSLYGRNPAQSTRLPFWYFQREHEGFLEVRSPGGFMSMVRPDDVCNVILAEPIEVRAMPYSTFCERLRMSPMERESTHGKHLYQPAHVLHVSKDRWGGIDRVGVVFLDHQFNNAPPTFANPVQPGTREALARYARRTRMPVYKYGDGIHSSAQNRESKEDASARRRFRAFLSSVLAGADAQATPSDA